ncbi:MAG: hypothetical protein OHK0056_20350 [Bacteriovoracaceae bacterium]
MKSPIVIALIALIIGFGIGRYTGHQSQPPMTQTPVEACSTELSDKILELESQAKMKLSSIVDSDQKISEMKKIYEELFQLFLANMALKLDKSFWKDVGEAGQIKIGESSSCPPVETPSPVVTPPIASLTSEPDIYVEAEDKSLPSLELSNQEQSDSKKFIYKSGKLINPTNYYLSSTPITSPNNRMIQRIQGKFRGEAFMKDPKEKRWGIFLNTQLSNVNRKWIGDVLVELSDEENGVFSRSSGQGENNNFNQHPEDPSSILIEASPDIFLHLKWRNSRDIFNGYIYKKSRDNRKWNLVGHIPYLKRE